MQIFNLLYTALNILGSAIVNSSNKIDLKQGTPVINSYLCAS